MTRWLAILSVVVLLIGGPGAAVARPHHPSPAAPAGGSSAPSPKRPHGQGTGQPSAQAKNGSHNGQCPKFPGADQFGPTIDNRFMPLVPGTKFTYHETTGGETLTDVVEVTHDTKVIMGVTTTVIQDNVTLQNGDPEEQTTDWYAQDLAGNVWYFGESTTEFPSGSTKGSWEAGVNGANPGIVMKANPKVGNTYRQECAGADKAADTAKVLKLSTSVSVPFGTFDNALLTEETSRFDSGVVEHKWYAPCIGVVRTEIVRGGHEVAELVDMTPASSGDCNSSSSGHSSGKATAKSAGRHHPSAGGGGAKTPTTGGGHRSTGGSGSATGHRGHGHHAFAGTGKGNAVGAPASTHHHHSGAGHGRGRGHTRVRTQAAKAG